MGIRASTELFLVKMSVRVAPDGHAVLRLDQAD